MAKKTYSPLRYPGGKNNLSEYVRDLIYSKKLNKSTYIEPFCGGAAVALYLLLNNHVKNIIINDYDRSIYAFWYSAIYDTDRLCYLINNTDITIEEWHKQRKVQLNKENEDLLSLGFSTLFLNRTNHSGIIKAGVIGGLEQKGEYKLDCRFNKNKIIEKIMLISQHRDNISIYNLDIQDLISNVIVEIKNKSFIFFDPPYYNKGSSLYTNFFKHEDHLDLSKSIKKIKYHSWIVTYDNLFSIKDMYKGFWQEEYKLNYSVKEKYKGEEVIIYSNTLKTAIRNGTNTILDYCEGI